MATLPMEKHSVSRGLVPLSLSLMLRERVARKRLVSIILWTIVVFQLITLPGALLMKSAIAVGIVLLGLGLCGVAIIFHRQGRITAVSVLLISVVDLGCGLMLLTTPTGLDVADLPIFDVLIVSLVIAVSLLPPRSVFYVAAGNVLFIVFDLLLQPKTPALEQLLASDMGYNVVVQPIALQIVIAVIAYIWVSSALRAITRADRAEEIAEIQRQESFRKQQLDEAIEDLSQALVRVANGDRTVHIRLHQDHVLWRVGNSVNLLLTRLRRASMVERENEQLRREIARLRETLRERQS